MDLNQSGLLSQGNEVNIVHIPKQNKSDFIQYGSQLEQQSQILPENTLILIGEKGQRTALASHGFQEGCFYFEIEMLPPLLPLPFINVQPALRIGFACQEDQNLQLPLGSNIRSYSYSSTGKVINAGKTYHNVVNCQFGQGDIVGALISLKPPKPKFLQQKPNNEGFEVSGGSYIEFYKNGVKQQQIFTDIYEGTYYAGVSLYMQAQCKINFGDQPFKYPPLQKDSQQILEQWKPYKDVINSYKYCYKRQ